MTEHTYGRTTSGKAIRVAWFASTAVAITIALLLAANAADGRRLTSGWPAAVFYLGFVGLPGAISVGVAHFSFTRTACAVVMVGVAFWAGCGQLSKTASPHSCST